MKKTINDISPGCTHVDDKEWVSEILMKLTPQMRAKAAIGYEAVFKEAYDNELVAHKKTNKARKAANQRLRLFVDKFYKAAMGQTIKPPITR